LAAMERFETLGIFLYIVPLMSYATLPGSTAFPGEMFSAPRLSVSACKTYAVLLHLEG